VPVRTAFFGSQASSPEVRQFADWVVNSSDHKGLPFVIVDKPNARVFVFDSSGRIRGDAAALLGSAPGDHSVPGIGERELSDMAPEDRTTPAGRFVAVAGMAVARQRPATANGVVFMLLEDEFGQMNLVVPPAVYDRFRPLVRAEPLLLARGRFERVGRNQNVLVRELESLGPLARRCADEADVFGSLPAAHHFGHR